MVSSCASMVRMKKAYRERTLEGDLVLLDVRDGSVGDGGLAVLDDWGHVDGLPCNGCL